MKRVEIVAYAKRWQSRPARGAWIETRNFLLLIACTICRAPHGARGLKHRNLTTSHTRRRSRPARGAWIETVIQWGTALTDAVAPRTGRVD